MERKIAEDLEAGVSLAGTAVLGLAGLYVLRLLRAALFGRRVAHKALGNDGGAAPIAATTAHGTAKALVGLLVALHATREARRARRGGAAACGGAPAFVKACVVKSRQ